MDNLKLDVLKEPRGFIRVLQFVFAICAFATTTNFGSSFTFTVNCANSTSTRITQTYGYPFRFDHLQVKQDACGSSYFYNYYGDYSSDAEFFVAAGVLAMLYAAGSIAFYCFFDSLYATNKTFPLVDFLVTLVLGVFWLSGSAAWASGVSSVKYVTNPDNFINTLEICKMNKGCVTDYAGNFAGLNISIIFGFLDFFLWAVNLWFLYKETSWFQAPAEPGAQSPS